MATPVRIHDDNYKSLKLLAQENRRSVVGELNLLLERFFNTPKIVTKNMSRQDYEDLKNQNYSFTADPGTGLLEPTVTKPKYVPDYVNEAIDEFRADTTVEPPEETA